MEAVNNMAIPSNVQEQLSLLSTNLSGIKGALIDKGCDIEDNDPLSSYVEKIGDMQVGDSAILINNGVNGYYTYNESSNIAVMYYKCDVPTITGEKQQYTGYTFNYEVTLPITFSEGNIVHWRFFYSGTDTISNTQDESSNSTFTYVSGNKAHFNFPSLNTDASSTVSGSLQAVIMGTLAS